MKMMMGAVLENGQWVMRQVDGSLEGLQALVEGHIEGLPILVPGDHLVSVFGNDEARLLGMAPSVRRMFDDGTVADVIVGPLVALGGIDDEGDSTDLTSEGFEALKQGMVPLPVASGVVRHSYQPEVRVIPWN